MTSPRSAHRLCLVLIAVMFLYRLSLLDRGAQAFVDETLYFTSVMALQSLAGGDVQGAFAHIAEARGRQGAALVHVPLAALQAIPSAFGVPASNPRSLLIPGVFNVIVSIVTLYVFFRLCLALCRDAWVALTTSVVYSLLVNTNLYVRHLLPYELAMLVGVYTMWLAMTRPRTLSLALTTGMLTGAMITCYSGYYLLAVALGAALTGQSLADGWRRGARVGLVFAAGVAATLGVIELVCRVGGVSYIDSSRALSQTISHGAFDEGWTFVPEYLVRVEGASGLALLLGTGVCVWRAASGVARDRRLGPIGWLLLSAVVVWAWQAANSAEWHRIVLYGRVIRPWILIMALAMADALTGIGRARIRTAACAVLASCAIVTWASSAVAYARLAYPSDVLYELGIDTTRLSPDRRLCELSAGYVYASPGPLDRVTRYPYAADGDYLLLNFCGGPPTLPPPSFAAEIGDRPPLYDGPHWLTFPAYGFEGFTPAARDAFVRNGYRVRAYRLSSSASPGKN